MKKFRRDLKKGQKYERLATEYFKYKKIFFPKGKFSDYDFILDDDVKVEVKSDIIASRSGNLAIEYKCRKKDSGIHTTKADFYVYVINFTDRDEFFKIPVPELKRLCKEYGRKVSGGDENASRMYLLDKDFVKDYLITEKLHDPYVMSEEDKLDMNRMNFGKYQGKTIEEIMKCNKGYLRWLLRQEWIEKELRKNIISAFNV